MIKNRGKISKEERKETNFTNNILKDDGIIIKIQLGGLPILEVDLRNLDFKI